MKRFYLMNAKAYELGTVVYLKYRTTNAPGIITGVTFRPDGVKYHVSWSSFNGSESEHYESQITDEYTPFFEGRSND